jgi:hypothetical protein
MADRLSIYKSALRYLGNAAGLSSLTEASPSRYALDDAWQNAGEYMLAKGLWNFAIRTSSFRRMRMSSRCSAINMRSPSRTDWVRTVSINNEATFQTGFEDFADETNYWYANSDTLYVRYISNDDDTAGT